MSNYSYQIKAADQVLRSAMSGRYKASVLAACPGAGKTTISHLILNRYVGMSSAPKKIVVLTEGKNILKNQYMEELQNANVKIDFSYGAFDSNAQVRIGLPQSIGKLDWTEIDMLLIDEAHNFFLADMVQSIIKKLNPKHIVLMTGSPTQFNNKEEYAIYYIAAEELQANGVFSGVNMDVVDTADKKSATQSIKDSLAHAIKKGANLSKIMVACPSISYAKEVRDYMTSIGYKVALSTSENDKDDSEIKAFKKGEMNVLVVVDKGILGFNDGNITLLIDLKVSRNLDSSYQLFARVLRKHPAGLRKSYYRIADVDYNNQVLTLHKMLALTKRENFVGFTGKNMEARIRA